MTRIEISLKTLLTIAALILLYQFLQRIAYVLVLIALAYIIMAAINPIIEGLEQKGIQRGISISIIYIFFVVALFIGVRFVLYPLIRESLELFKQLPILVRKVIETNGWLQSLVGANKAAFLANISIASHAAGKSITAAASNTNAIYRTAVGTTRFIASFLSVIIMSLYMLIYKEQNNTFLAGLFPKKQRNEAKRVIGQVEDRLGQWMRAQLILSFVVFLLNYIVLFFLHINFALTISLIAGFLEVIPVAGPLIAALIAFSLTLIITPGVAFYVLAASILIHQLEAHFLVPKIMQTVIGLNPLVTIIALLIGAELVGVIGAILAVPIATTLQLLYLEYKKYD